MRLWSIQLELVVLIINEGDLFSYIFWSEWSRVTGYCKSMGGYVNLCKSIVNHLCLYVVI